MDRQVEVVAGHHVLVRVAGAVIVIAHREPGRPGPRSSAVRIAEAVSEVVRGAAAAEPDEPGRQIARDMTRWLMREAEQVDGPIELGIVSGSEAGGVAIFLHGPVTVAVVGARGTEFFRGVDAAFTVDRRTEAPARAVAMFVDDERGRIPDLPERGIGSLVEGMAPAVGAVIWFEGERAPAVAETGTGEQAVGDPRTAAEPDRGAGNPQVENIQVDPAPGPAPSPGLERRMEATARATSPTVRVRGFTCARAHPSDPRSAFCTVCGMPVDQTQPLLDVVRPPLGMLVLDDGMSFLLTADSVIGRDPENSEAAQRGLAPLTIEDGTGGMSRAHAEILLVDWDVTIVDRGSTNGTSVRPPGYPERIRLQPGRPMVLVQGAEIRLGNRGMRLEPAAPPPFG